MSKAAKIIELAGPSGSGKSTIAQKLLADFDNLFFSISATTREPRSYERHGREYYFISDEEFDEHIKAENFLEWEQVYKGTRYGTLKSEVDKQLKSGYFTLLDIDVEGALNVKKIYGINCLAIFIQPPSLSELRERLVDRKTESKQALEQRMERARREMQYINHFDFTVINYKNKLDETYSKVKKRVSSFIKQN